ncbi:DUF6053 domain-containing protein [Lysobacter enzymogenes]|uniref:DUF6053 domain-containing protein n=1 Tax=Lysobacter enzymogenes TaxID=69 RepID=UPI003CCE533B
MRGPSGPMLSVPMTAIRHKSIGPEDPPATALNCARAEPPRYRRRDWHRRPAPASAPALRPAWRWSGSPPARPRARAAPSSWLCASRPSGSTPSPSASNTAR